MGHVSLSLAESALLVWSHLAFQLAYRRLLEEREDAGTASQGPFVDIEYAVWHSWGNGMTRDRMVCGRRSRRLAFTHSGYTWGGALSQVSENGGRPEAESSSQESFGVCVCFSFFFGVQVQRGGHFLNTR